MKWATGCILPLINSLCYKLLDCIFSQEGRVIKLRLGARLLVCPKDSCRERGRRPLSSHLKTQFNIFMFGAQDLYIAINAFPFYAYTLCCLVPRRCRVSLQPGLVGHDSLSFLGLQDAQTPVLKPDNSGSSRLFIGTTANGGAANRQKLLHAHFLIKRLSFVYTQDEIF